MVDETRKVKVGEAMEKLAKGAERFAEKLATGMERAAEQLEKRDIPRITRNIVILTTAAMSMWTMYYALMTMMPAAAVVFLQMGLLLGYLVPLVFMMMLMGIVVGVLKALTR